MPIELTIMETDSNSLKHKIALIGGEQNGKSRLAATAPSPVLFHDFDNKKESLKGLKGVYVISYIDPKWPNFPTAAQDFLTNITQLEKSLDLHDLGFQVPKGTYVKTNVIDTIQTLAKACNAHALNSSADLRREISFGGFKVFFNKGWDAVNAEMEEVYNTVMRIIGLPTNTIVCMHETEEQAADSTPEKKKFTGRIDVYPPRYRMLLKYFPEVWRVKLTQSVVAGNKLVYLPKVYPLPTPEFDSGTTMLLDPVEDPNIQKMIEKHEQRFKQASGPLLPGGQNKQLTTGGK